MSVPIMRSCRSARAELGLAGLPAGRLALSLELLPAAHKSYARATGGGGRKDMQRGRAGERREWCDRMWPRARCTRGGVVRHTARALKEGVVAAGVRTSARPRSWPTADALPAGGAGAGAQSAASTRAASCRPRAPGHPQALPALPLFANCRGAPAESHFVHEPFLRTHIRQQIAQIASSGAGAAEPCVLTPPLSVAAAISQQMPAKAAPGASPQRPASARGAGPKAAAAPADFRRKQHTAQPAEGARAAGWGKGAAGKARDNAAGSAERPSTAPAHGAREAKGRPQGQPDRGSHASQPAAPRAILQREGASAAAGAKQAGVKAKKAAAPVAAVTQVQKIRGRRRGRECACDCCLVGKGLRRCGSLLA